MCRRDFSIAISKLQEVVPPPESIVTPVKVMIDEIKQLCSKKENSSLFRDDDKAIRDFKWNPIWLELESRVPTVSMAVKWQSSKMSLVQRVISTVMYGNGASKEVSMFK